MSGLVEVKSARYYAFVAVGCDEIRHRQEGRGQSDPFFRVFTRQLPIGFRQREGGRGRCASDTHKGYKWPAEVTSTIVSEYFRGTAIQALSITCRSLLAANQSAELITQVFASCM